MLDTLPTDDELRQKFLWLASPVLGEDRCAVVMETVWSLEQADDVGVLVRLCSGIGRDRV